MGSVTKCIERQMAILASGVLNAKDLAARAKVIGVLGGSGCEGIDFRIPGASVTASMFTDVQKQVLFGNILVGEWNTSVDGYKKDAAAMYDQKVDKIYVDLTTDDESLASVVHESVHAAHDISTDRLMFVLTTETAAYIAECVWKLKNQNEARRTITGGNDKSDLTDKIYAAAWDIAQRNLARGDYTGQTPQIDFDANILEPLFTAVKAVYTDWNNFARFDGLTSVCG